MQHTVFAVRLTQNYYVNGENNLVCVYVCDSDQTHGLICKHVIKTKFCLHDLGSKTSVDFVNELNRFNHFKMTAI